LNHAVVYELGLTGTNVVPSFYQTVVCCIQKSSLLAV